MHTLAGHVWPTVPHAATVLVPVGSIEQHGLHLPLDTDTAIAVGVAERVVDMVAVPGLLVAPALSFGSSGEHQDFPGTVSIGTDALRVVIVELVRSMRTWAQRVVLINAHGGNIAAIDAAVDQLKLEGHDVDWFPCATEEVDLHAGFTETSLMLHLRPEDVRLDAAEAGNCAPLEEILPIMVHSGVRAVSPNGVLGDPNGASASLGREMLDRMAHSIADRIGQRAHA